MRESPLVSSLLAPLQFALQPTLLVALLLHGVVLAIPLVASDSTEETAAEAAAEDNGEVEDDLEGEDADFPALDGMPDGETPALGVPPIAPKLVAPAAVPATTA
ncbi:MAG: hypothetical protein HC838_10010, partial [Spirulinaceae cyanobacterium RM2_2_10]|nr:hypothetical protein [Spirulinaceae cyanobacterium RM2_2_10]